MSKKIVAVILAVLLMSTNFTVYAKESGNQKEKTSTQMANLDVLIASSMALNSNIVQDDILRSGTKYKEIVPLYNPNGEIVAYYVSFLPTGYGVVNNNINNPSLIEFGEGDNKLIREILENTTSPHIIYNNPFDVYQANSEVKSVSSKSSLYDYYPDLLKSNLKAVNQHNKHKAALQEAYPSMGIARGDGDYGFIDWGNMPSGNYTWDMIDSAASVDWAVTGDYSFANNHCGAVAITNIALYFAQRGYSNLKINGSKNDTFNAVYNIVGDGPEMTIAGNASQYFSNRGYSLNYSSVSNSSAVMTAIGNDRPCGILLAEGIVSWHWIICVGYRNYTSTNDIYFRIVNGWDNTTLIFYKPYSGSAWISATQYWM